MTFDGGTTTASRSDLVFTATTGPAKTGIEELRATFAKATAGMSDDALKLQQAQERADNAVIRSHGRVTSSTLAAELNLRKVAAANEATAGSSDAASLSLSKEATELERVGRGAAVGTGLLHGLGRAATFSSTAFLGGAGLVYAVREFTKAAQDQQANEAQTAAALKAQGINYATYKGSIDEALGSLERLSGFSEDETVPAFTKLVRTTGDVESGMKRTALAAQIARGATIPLANATNIVNKALAGSLTGLRRLGIEIPKGATGYQGLEIASQKFAGSLQANADTAAGAQERLAIAIHQTEVAIGNDLNPTIKSLETRLANWLGDTKNQERIQRDANAAVKDGTAIVHGLVDAEEKIAPPIKLVIGALGGLERAVELALVVGLALKVRKGASSFGLIQSASARARTQVVADASVEEEALAGVAAQAERTAGVVSRVGAYTGPGGAVPPGAVAPGAPTGRPGLSSNPLLAAGGYLFGTSPDITANSPNDNPQANETTLIGSFKLGQHVTIGGKPYTVTRLDNNYAYATPGFTTVKAPAGAAASGPGFGGITPAVNAIGARAPSLTLTPAQQRAQALALHPDALPALTAQRDYDDKAIAFLQQQHAEGKKSGAEYIKELQALTADRDSQQSTIDSINQAAAAKAAAAAAKQAAAAKTAAEKAAAARRKAAAEAKARAAKDARDYRTGLSTRELGLRDSAGQEVRAQLRGVGATIRGGQVARFVEPTDERKLVAFLKKEIDDQKLSKAERARYRHLYITELNNEQKDEDAYDKQVTDVLKKANEKRAAAAKKQLAIKDAIFQNRLSEAQLAETRAGTNATKLKKARAGELAAQLAILHQEEVEGRHLTGLAKQQNLSQQIQTEEAIAQLRQASAPAASTSGANESQFLSSAQSIISSYSPNFTEGSSATRLYELVHETRKTNQHLSEIKKTARFPGTYSAKAALEAAVG